MPMFSISVHVRYQSTTYLYSLSSVVSSKMGLEMRIIMKIFIAV